VLILSASDLHVPLQERPHFDALRRETLRDIQPMNSVQIELCNSALRAAWTIRRCDAAERDLAQELGLDPLLATDKRIDRIHRFRAQAHREYRMALHELKRLQTDFAIRRLKENEGLLALPVAVDSKTYIAAARAAGGFEKKQRISFPPVQAALDEFVRAKGWGETAWEAWFHQSSLSEPRQMPIPINRQRTRN
jgi:hypothetical protein